MSCFHKRVSRILSTGGGYGPRSWQTLPWAVIPWTDPPPNPGDGYRSRRYASYWNAFLFPIFMDFLKSQYTIGKDRQSHESVKTIEQRVCVSESSKSKRLNERLTTPFVCADTKFCCDMSQNDTIGKIELKSIFRLVKY